MIWLLIVMLSCWSSSSLAEVYKCESASGVTSYQFLPCENGVAIDNKDINIPSVSDAPTVSKPNMRKKKKRKNKANTRNSSNKITRVGEALAKNIEKQDVLCLQLEEKILTLEERLRAGYKASEAAGLQSDLRLARRTFNKSCK